MGASQLQEEAARRVGTVLKGKWSLDRLIGTGGTAAVYEARHRNGSRVAVKVMHGRVALSAGQRTRFHTEGNAANRVGHPGVTVVYDDEIADDGSPFLVMELLRGQTVAERAAERGGVLEPREVLQLAERLLDVLAAAHEKGVVHRDIKPQNLFLTDAGVLKVLDFGIARHRDPDGSPTSTEVGLVLGTPAFLPPEQARGRPDEIDARSDLWAVGATMYTLLTGRFVHEAPTSNEQMGLAMMATAPSLANAAPTLPKPLVDVVDRALAYAREDRWSSAGAMQAAVRWLLERWEELGDPTLDLPETWMRRETNPDLVTLGSPAVPASPGLPSPAAEPHRSRRILTPLLLAAGIAGIVGIAGVHRFGAAARAEPSEEAPVHPELAPEVLPTVASQTLAAVTRPEVPAVTEVRREPHVAQIAAVVVRRRNPPAPPAAVVPAVAQTAPVSSSSVAEDTPAARKKAVKNPLDRRY